MGSQVGGRGFLSEDPRFSCLKWTHFGVASNFHCEEVYTLFKNWAQRRQQQPLRVGKCYPQKCVFLRIPPQFLLIGVMVKC